MNFLFSETQSMMAESARSLLADRHPLASIRKAVDGAGLDLPAILRDFAELGAPALLVEEARDGLGLGEADLVLIAEACGHGLMPDIVVEQAGLVAPLLSALADAPECAEALQLIVSGSGHVAIAHPLNPLVADAVDAAFILEFTPDEIFLTDANGARPEPARSVDPLRTLFVINPDPSARKRIASGARARELAALLADRGALFAAAQALGLAERALELAVDYAQERKQFGKPIGSYQAVKHMLATAKVKIEFAKPIVYAAAAQIRQNDVYSRARISHAKLAALDAADCAARASLQAHGAMGYSWEVDVHFILKRVLSLGGEWGDAIFHRARVKERILNNDVGPEHAFAREGR